MALLQLHKISTASTIGNTYLSEVSIEVKPNEKVALMGETGSGKTTLLKTIAGLHQHTLGEIIFDDKKILGPNHQLIAGNKGISYISQQSDLRHNYKMNDLLTYANKYDAQYLKQLIALCNVEHLLQRNSRQLSGGEKQRLALLKLLLEKPKLILLDEPYSNLDKQHEIMMHNILEELGDKNDCSFLMSAHRKEEVLAWADYIYILQEGKIVQEGTATEIYFKPENIYVAGLLGDYTEVTPQLKALLNIHEGIAFLRPEQLEIKQSDEPNAVVINCMHQGGYYKNICMVDDQKVVVNSVVRFEKKTQIILDCKF
jgi:ABC-type Fe3+/spermidine/putrescine transport system ATPase subunit